MDENITTIIIPLFRFLFGKLLGFDGLFQPADRKITQTQTQTAHSIKQELGSAGMAIALLMALGPGIATAQPCSAATMFGIYNMGTIHDAQASSTTILGPGPFELFIGLGCAGTSFGGATACGTIPGPGGAALFAEFSSTAANTSNAGCTFMCPGGTCKVKGGSAGGLPVELMEFSVDE